jgi:hypothetical protein
MDTQHKRNWFARHKLLTGLIAAFILFMVIGAATSSDKPKGAAKYVATVQNYSVTDPATLRVDIKVHNTGNASGKPNCQITTDNGTRAYHGVDRVVRDTDLGANEWWGFAQNITITNQGAEHIRDVTVDCK